MTPQTALGRILVSLRFASPPIGGLLVYDAQKAFNDTQSGIYTRLKYPAPTPLNDPATALARNPHSRFPPTNMTDSLRI